jgi:hypothetical protein
VEGDEQAAHERLTDDEGAVPVCPSPAAHKYHGAHSAAVFVAAVNWPPGHAAQTVSAVAVPETSLYLPAAHCACVLVHAPLPAAALNLPLSHAVQVWSELAVAALFMYSPTAHGALTAAHALPLSAAENVVPTVHVEHVTLLLAVPAVDTPSPATHVAHPVQAVVDPVPLANVDAGQSLQLL